MIPRLPLATALIALRLLTPGAALACAFHNYAPADTVVDRMLGSAQIVFARPDPADPARFVAVATLSGATGDVGIELPVDAETAARLAAHPEDSVLFARDGDYGPWLRLAYLDPDYRAVIERIAPRLEDWQMGGEAERAQIFADLLDHPNPGLHRLALTELDLLPYEVLRGLALRPSAPALAAELGRGPEAPVEDGTQPLDLDPIRVLLIGLSPDPQAGAVLEEGLARELSTPGSRILGAYATALIEGQGAEGADRIAALLTAGTPPAPDAAEMLVEALAIHSQSGAPALRARIGADVARALDTHPALAGAVARQFGSRYDWSQTAPLQALLRDKRLTSALEVIPVTQYLALAQEAGAATPSQ